MDVIFLSIKVVLHVLVLESAKLCAKKHQRFFELMNSSLSKMSLKKRFCGLSLQIDFDFVP
jgi:hypothetical protein